MSYCYRCPINIKIIIITSFYLLCPLVHLLLRWWLHGVIYQFINNILWPTSASICTRTRLALLCGFRRTIRPTSMLVAFCAVRGLSNIRAYVCICNPVYIPRFTPSLDLYHALIQAPPAQVTTIQRILLLIQDSAKWVLLSSYSVIFGVFDDGRSSVCVTEEKTREPSR